MTSNMWLRVLCAMQVNAVLFGIGAVTILSIPALNELAKYLIPVAIGLSIVLSVWLSGFVARRMRIRNWGRDAWRTGDAISG